MPARVKWWLKQRYAFITGRCFCGAWGDDSPESTTRHAWDHCCQGPGCNRCWRIEMGIRSRPAWWRVA